MNKGNYNSKLKITSICENDKITLKESHQYRVGRAGCITFLNDGYPLHFTYADGHGVLVTSNIVDWTEDDYGVLVETENTVYRFDYIYDEDDTKIVF